MADVAGEVADDGTGFRYPLVVLSVPRRAGKSALMLAVCMDRLDVTGDARCWYTMQTGATCTELFRAEWIPALDRPNLDRLYRLRRSEGRETVEKRHGSSKVRMFAPEKDALHGMNADTVVIDEAWAVSVDTGDALEAAIRPAQLTRRWRQLWIVSAGGTLDSTWWDRWLTAGEQAATGVALFDYGADASAPGYDPADPAVWATAHPSAGYGFPLDALAHEWATRRDDASFERAYLNVWPRPSTVLAAGGLDLDAWRTAARPEVTADPVTALAVDVNYDRSAATLVAAGPNDRHGVTVEVLAHRPGVAWLAAEVRRARQTYRGARIVADSLVAAGLVAELNRARVTVDAIGVRDHAQACGMFVDALAAGDLTHRAQPPLDDAVLGAARRPLGDAWLWSRARSNADISPLVAATLAAWSVKSRPAGGRPAVIVVDDPPPSTRRRTPNAPLRGTQPRFR